MPTRTALAAFTLLGGLSACGSEATTPVQPDKDTQPSSVTYVRDIGQRCVVSIYSPVEVTDPFEATSEDSEVQVSMSDITILPVQITIDPGVHLRINFVNRPDAFVQC